MGLVQTDDFRGSVGILTGASLDRQGLGGTKAYVIGLAAFLRGRGIAVTLFTNGPVDGELVDCRLVPISAEHRPSTLSFHRALHQWDPGTELRSLDILHLQRPDELWPLRKRALPPRVVCTLHGNPRRGIQRRKGVLAGAIYRVIEASIINRFAALIAVDPSTAGQYRKFFPSLASKVHVIPNAVAPAWLESSDASSPPGVSQPPHFLFAGRLSVEKRVDVIVAALRSSPLLEGARLTIAGAGPEERRLRNLSQGLNVRFVGVLDRVELARLYHSADALVLASEYEGLPSVAIEALACGCPVVALSDTGLEGTVRGRGTTANSVETLPNAMAEAVRIRRSGVAIQPPNEFTWSAVGPQILDVYSQVTAIEEVGDS